MATIGIDIRDQDLLDAGPSGIQTGGTQAQQGDTDGTGRLVNTVSLVSTDTIISSKVATPLTSTSRPNTPATAGLQIRPLTPLLQARPPAPPITLPRGLLRRRGP